MLDRNESINFWNDYVTVDTANDFFSAMFTKLGYLVKIQDTTPPRRNVKTKCIVLTQSLNHHHFERYVKKIAEEVAHQVLASSRGGIHTGGVTRHSRRQANHTRKRR
jgi:hypothetical protein